MDAFRLRFAEDGHGEFFEAKSESRAFALARKRESFALE
jgi:hypothetical protein